ncbi:MAG: DUF393 domain-containing protein [Thiohalocapsa sp.]|nr:DUF393 domain-containing protein [Thiohalocapsa sp.]MCF7993096.1 DUF393 domain-containing protein [Thiohalocapsa sp.]
MQQQTSALTVFYDGGCPMCSKEIAHYRRVDGAERIDWVDITAQADADLPPDVDRDLLMRRLHVREADGRLVAGVPAFLAIWRRLRPYRRLGRTVEVLRLGKLLDAGYARFADWRYRRRCRDGVCTLPPQTRG